MDSLFALRTPRAGEPRPESATTPVIIVGGGIAGLATAYELHRRQVSFVLLESRERAGGVILSEQVDGYTLDAGPDALLAQKTDGLKLCEELGLGGRLVPSKKPRQAFIQRAGRLHALPAASVLGIPTRWGPFIRTSLFSWPGKLRMGAELFVPPRRGESDESIGAFMARRFGAEARTYLAEPLLAGIHAGDVDRLSMAALFPRLVEAERTHGSLLRAFRRQRAAPQANGPFLSLPDGLSELARALVASLPGDAVRLNTTVNRVTPDRASGSPHTPRFRVDTADGTMLHSRVVVLAVPAFAAARLLRETDTDLARLCDRILYASTATIALAFPRTAVAHPLNGSGFVVPSVEGTGILAGSWLSSKWPNRAPPDRVLLRTFVGGARDPKALERSDRELVALSLNALRPLLGISGDPLLARVYRWERASAQHDVGHLARLGSLEQALAKHPGLYLTGSGFRGVGIPDCVTDGRATAARVSEGMVAA